MMSGGGDGLLTVFPFLYGTCFVLLLWQAFRVMGQGYTDMSDLNRKRSATDRTGRLTIHPELLDGNGQLTREDLLTVRFDGDSAPTE